MHANPVIGIVYFILCLVTQLIKSNIYFINKKFEKHKIVRLLLLNGWMIWSHISAAVFNMQQFRHPLKLG